MGSNLPSNPGTLEGWAAGWLAGADTLPMPLPRTASPREAEVEVWLGKPIRDNRSLHIVFCTTSQLLFLEVGITPTTGT